MSKFDFAFFQKGKWIILVLVGSIILISCVTLCIGLLQDKSPAFAVQHNVNSELGIVTFSVDELHSFTLIYMGEHSWVKHPLYNETNQIINLDGMEDEVSFSALDIPVGKIQFLTFYYKEKSSEAATTGQMNFEILRQNESEIIITAYPTGAAGPWYDFSYALDVST